MFNINSIRSIIVIALLSAAISNAVAGVRILDPAETSRSNSLTQKKIEYLVELARYPQKISVRTVEHLFETNLKKGFCTDYDWACRWGAGLEDDQASLTNVFLPNEKARRYRTGGRLMLEIPRNTCIAVEEIADRLQSKPMPLPDLPAHPSFSQAEDTEVTEVMLEFRNIPEMSKQVTITSWTQADCLVRLELNALIKYED